MNKSIIDVISKDRLKDVREFSLDGLETDGRVVSCYDGDSLKIVFSNEGSIFQWNCRLFGIDTPELRTRDLDEKAAAIKARNFLSELVLGKVVIVKCHEFDKYGRVLVSVFVDGLSVTETMIKNGHGYSYDGGSKKPWFFKDPVV